MHIKISIMYCMSISEGLLVCVCASNVLLCCCTYVSMVIHRSFMHACLQGVRLKLI